MHSLFSQLILLVALVLVQNQSWAENNCQHMTKQPNLVAPLNHESMDHSQMGHENMGHDNMTNVPPEQDCCNDCTCEMNSCQSQTWLHACKILLSYDAQSFEINFPLAWQLKKHNNELLRPPSFT